MKGTYTIDSLVVKGKGMELDASLKYKQYPDGYAYPEYHKPIPKINRGGLADVANELKSIAAAFFGIEECFINVYMHPVKECKYSMSAYVCDQKIGEASGLVW